MALDFSLMEESEKPGAHVPLGLTSWSHIVGAAEKSDLTLIQRMSDYYQDAHFDPAEVSQLASELVRLKTELIAAERVITEMLVVCRQAEAKQAPIMAIAD